MWAVNFALSSKITIISIVQLLKFSITNCAYPYLLKDLLHEDVLVLEVDLLICVFRFLSDFLFDVICAAGFKLNAHTGSFVSFLSKYLLLSICTFWSFGLVGPEDLFIVPKHC